MSRVIIAGSRTIKDYDLLKLAIEEAGFDITTVLSGHAYSGVDKIGEKWAEEHGIQLELYPADWKNLKTKGAIIRYNKQGAAYNAVAGHQRNELMATKADALILLHDGVSSGSLDMLNRAEQHGLTIYKKVINVEKHTKEKRKNLHLQTIDWAEQMVKNTSTLVLDTESCGGSANDEIISLAIVRLHNGEIVFNSLLKPSTDVKFNWYATQVHGIQEEMLQDSPMLKDLYPEVYEILHNQTVLAFNYSADKRMIEQTMRKQSLIMPKINWHCIMKAYKHFSQNGSVTNLTAACKEVNVKAGNHDAVEDALAAARVVHRISQRYKLEK